MAKMTMSKKKEDEVLLPMGQKKPLLHRYWLQVDRQTKSSYQTIEEAEKAAKAIKSVPSHIAGWHLRRRKKSGDNHPSLSFIDMASDRTQPPPKRLSMTSDRQAVSSSAASHTPPLPVSSPRYVLPRDLPSAIKQIDDKELDRLLAAVLAEQKRRGGKSPAPIQPSQKHPLEPVGRLTTGKLNAVRAAFGAGIKPTQIARQFGLSDADVRSALASQKKG